MEPYMNPDPFETRSTDLLPINASLNQNSHTPMLNNLGW